MKKYIGIIDLNTPLSFFKEVSGQTFQTKVAEHTVLIIIPSIPDNYNTEKVDLANGDLIIPMNLFKRKLNWGKVMAWPLGLFTVNHLLCLFNSPEECVQEIYDNFEHWKMKLNNLHLINTGDYILPDQKEIKIFQGGGLNVGLQVFELSNEKKLQPVLNNKNVETINLKFVGSKECYSNETASKLFDHAGNISNIELSYELLMSAYSALKRNDYRSAVILAGSGIEKAILNKMRQTYPKLQDFEDKKKAYKMLGGKFKWLEENSLNIPVQDYRTDITNIRNKAAHEGVCPTYQEAKLCLEKSKILIETYSPNVLEM